VICELYFFLDYKGCPTILRCSCQSLGYSENMVTRHVNLKALYEQFTLLWLEPLKVNDSNGTSVKIRSKMWWSVHNIRSSYVTSACNNSSLWAPVSGKSSFPVWCLSFVFQKDYIHTEQDFTIPYKKSVKEGFPYFCDCRTILDFESSDKHNKGKVATENLTKRGGQFCSITKISCIGTITN